MNFLLSIVAGALGILLYAFLSARDKNDTQVLNVMDYIRNHYSRWLLSLGVLIVMALIILVVPEGASSIKAVTGLDVSSTSSFITIGYIASSAGRKLVR